MTDPSGSFVFSDFRTRLYNLAHRLKPSDRDADPTEEVILFCVGEITRLIGANSSTIVTVRERSGFREAQLRHVYASPESIRKWFDDDEDKKLAEGQTTRANDIEADAFGDPRALAKAKIRCDGNKIGRFTRPVCYASAFALALKMNANVIDSVSFATTPTSKPKDKHIFEDRIQKFLKDSSADVQDNMLLGMDKINGCIVFGLTGPPNYNFRVDKLFAVYFEGFPKDVNEAKVDDCAQIANEMFRAIDEIRARKRLEVERQALEDIVALTPLVASENFSPSDTVATLRKKFVEIFHDQGVLGRPTSGAAGNQHQWVTYLTINYRQPENNYRQPEKMSGQTDNVETATPILAVYPKSIAKQNPVQSYRVSRPEVPSISKYFVYRMLSEAETALPKGFGDIFTDCDILDKAFYRDPQSNQLRALVLTHHDRDWTKLQFNIFSKQTKTTAVFPLRRSVVPGGDTHGKPFAILVFESDFADAFSDDDIKLISRLVEASASLLSNTKFPGQSIDYSARIQKAFSGRNVKVGKIDYWRIQYELMRFDPDAAAEILNDEKIVRDNSQLGSNPDDRLATFWQGSGALSEKDVRSNVREIVQRVLELKDSEDKFAFDRWLRNNRDTYQDLVCKWSEHSKDIYSFLMAVPPNDVWHCYLGSIERALVNRFGPSHLPKFSPFQPGHSALEMFIVDGDDEEPQIAKLTTKEKLDREAERYEEFIRYRIPLAARIPENGITFDTTGTPFGEQGDPGYGVIVSELISGNATDKEAGRPLSLLSLCVWHLNRDIRSGVPNLDQIITALDYHFRKSVSVWKDLGKKKWQELAYSKEKENVASHIERLTRTGPNESGDNIDARFREVLSRLNASDELASVTAKMLTKTQAYAVKHFSANLKLPEEDLVLSAIVEMLVEWRQLINEPGLPDMTSELFYRSSCVHRDLNGSNLTWAAHSERFVMIDFEFVEGAGFIGIDQLKLFASLLAELAPASHERRASEKSNGNDTVSDAEHHAVIELMKIIPWLCDEVLAAGDKDMRTKSFDEHMGDSLKSNLPLSYIAVQILRTIDFGDGSLGESEQLFWRWTIRNMLYKQFEYSFRSLNTSHIDGMKAVINAISDSNGEFPNVVKNAQDDNVTNLFYTYLALLLMVEVSQW